MGIADLASKSKTSRQTTRATKAGRTVPPSRVNRAMKLRSGLKRVGGTAPVYMAAVMEYVAAEILEVACNSTANAKRKRVTPEDISIALRSDADLQKVCGGLALYTGDRLESVAKALVPKARTEPKKTATAN